MVGGLPENLDAYPHPGESAPRLTGTYLQGWSNAEQLRVWYQGFLGLQPDLEQGVLRLAPRLPNAVGDVEFNSRIGAGVLHSRYERFDLGRRYTWRLQGQAVRLDVEVQPDRPRPGDPVDQLQRALDQRQRHAVILRLRPVGRAEQQLDLHACLLYTSPSPRD